jgi:hypothetical protein
VREAGGVPARPAARALVVEEYLPKLGEWMERSKGRLRADVAHDKLLGLGFTGSETLRRVGGAPTYVLTDNEKTVTASHVAGIAVRNPAMVGFARHYGVTVHACEPADPVSKGGSEST